MRQTLEILDHTVGVRRRTLVVAMVLVSSLAALFAASPAVAITREELKKEFLPFADCPIAKVLATGGVCLVATTSSGEFVISQKTVPINKTITLQGGLATLSFLSQPLVAAKDGKTLSKTPLTVPGGLVGIAGLGGEVTATAEIAGPASSVIINKGNLLAQSGTAVTLPVKVKLDNPVLGNECYIGTNSEPIVLHLTTGTTSPPPPAQPISGKRGTLEGKAKGKITAIKENSLVDNTFSVPGASGCGEPLSLVVDAAVNLDVGIPSAPGANTAIMNGGLEEALAKFAQRYKT